MAFDRYLGYRSQGVNPSMYSNDREEAMRMMDEDMAARWAKDRAGFQKAMLDQRILERQGKGNAAPEEQPKQEQPQQARQAQGNAMGDAPMAWPGMHPAQGGGPLQRMVDQTNAAFRKENDSRVRQAEDERDRQHELQMAEMQLQAKGGRQQQEYKEPQQTPGDEVRKARNRNLLGMAGLGGHTIRSGRGGAKVTPHQFGNSPFASSLLGD